MSRNYTYSKIKAFGPNKFTPLDNPLSYCIDNTIDQRFNHSGNATVTCGQNTKNCQAFLSEYCANGWDGYCEYASKNTGVAAPNNIAINKNTSIGMTQGDILVYNTAVRKYLSAMGNGTLKYEKFDPLVAMSPMISYWVPTYEGGSSVLVPVFVVDPFTIDQDVVMDKMLAKPNLYMDIFVNIYNNMKREGKLQDLQGTKLGSFYQIIFADQGGLNPSPENAQLARLATLRQARPSMSHTNGRPIVGK